MLYSAPEAVAGSPAASQRLSFHPFVRSAPSFHPDLRAAGAVARSGCQGWPAFGPPHQRRAASLTAVSTTACSVASGASPPHTNQASKSANGGSSKNKIMLTGSDAEKQQRDRRRLDRPPSLSEHCGHGTIFLAQRCVVTDPPRTPMLHRSTRRTSDFQPYSLLLIIPR